MALARQGVQQLKGRREKETHFALLPLTVRADFPAVPYRSDWLDFAEYPSGSLHIYGVSLVGLTLDVVISNVPTDGFGEVVATNVAAEKVVALTQGARYVQVVVKTLTSGSVGAEFSAALQS